MAQEPERRTFLSVLTFGIGAIFSGILGFPVACYIIDPRHRKAPPRDFKLVDEFRFNEVPHNDPVQGVVRDTRVDGWTLYPNDVIGRVWIVRFAAERVNIATREEAEAFNGNQARKDAYMKVFTTICPHLGCSVNKAAVAANGFACPCHSATFNLDGARANDQNPAKRGMDALEWIIDTDDPTFNRIKVKYRRFQALVTEEEKIPEAERAPKV
jgi:Rieske Fe-S protein